jgi:pimeloyl-ACP methyl ester carboxylesterase
MTDFAFLHGGGQGGWVWAQTIAAIAAQSGGAARCLALDAPGCGARRGRDTSAITFAGIARELIADVEAAGLRDVVLVGHSQAGMTLPQMAEFAPRLFARLIYVTCSAPLPGVSTLAQMGQGRHGENVDEVGYPVDAEATMAERFRAMFCNDMTAPQADAFLTKLGADMWPMVCYSHDDWRYDHLRAIPSSYVVCLRDRALPPAWQHRFADRLHARRIHRIDAGHQVMNTRPQALAEILLAETEAGHG